VAILMKKMNGDWRLPVGIFLFTGFDYVIRGDGRRCGGGNSRGGIELCELGLRGHNGCI